MLLSYFDDFVDQYAHPRANDYYWANSVWKPFGIIALYMLFLKRIGPWYMENRKPYNVKYFIMIFDVLQIIANFYLLLQAVKYMPRMKGTVFCREIDYSDSEEATTIRTLTYYYYLLKISDVIDTVFFILKKSYRQVSYLHVYHHALMIFSAWFALKFVGGAHGVYVGILNVVVHTVMYTYYLLSAYDPKYKQNLTFKKHVTQLQMAQFVLVIIMNAPALRSSCNFPKVLIYLSIIQAIYFLYLFGNFYYQNYIKMNKNKDKKQH